MTNRIISRLWLVLSYVWTSRNASIRLTSKIWLAFGKSLWYKASATKHVGFASIMEMKSIALSGDDTHTDNKENKII